MRALLSSCEVIDCGEGLALLAGFGFPLIAEGFCFETIYFLVSD